MTVVRTTDVRTSVIRPAVQADIPSLLMLYHELHEAHRTHHPELFSPTLSRDPAALARSVDDARVGFFVAEFDSDAGSQVGGLLRVIDTQTPDGGALLSRRFGLVDELVVMPEYRQRGIAGLLMSHAEQWALARGIGALEVTVWAFNQAATDLYVKRGFAPLRHYLRKTLVNSLLP